MTPEYPTQFERTIQLSHYFEVSTERPGYGVGFPEAVSQALIAARSGGFEAKHVHTTPIDLTSTGEVILMRLSEFRGDSMKTLASDD